MFIFDLLYEYTENVVPPLAAGLTTSVSTYLLSNAAINLIPQPIKEILKLLGAGVAGVAAAVATSETVPVAVAFAATSGLTYAVLAFGGEKIQKVGTTAVSIAAGAVTTSAMAGSGFFFNDSSSSLPSVPSTSTTMPTNQHVGR